MPDPRDRSPELARPSRHLFLSPHYDDIALSAGGTVRTLADHGLTPETLIIFGSEPDAARPLSPFAQAMHEGWGFTASEVIASRQAEESAASALLGAAHRVLPFRDAIYRGDYYLSDEDLFGEPNCSEHDLPTLIAAAIRLPAEPTGELRLYAPLAIGNHVDHQLVFEAGVQMARAGWDVWFYEDIPYALKPGTVEQRLAAIRRSREIEPAARVPAGSAWETKVDAIFSYPSQLETIFRNYVGIGTSREDISEALRAYATREDDGTLTEVFWTVK